MQGFDCGGCVLILTTLYPEPHYLGTTTMFLTRSASSDRWVRAAGISTIRNICGE